MAQTRDSGQAGIEHDAALHGIIRVFNRELNRNEWVATCDGCAKREARPFATDASPKYMITKFEQHGWLWNGKTPICPTCKAVPKRKAMTEPTKLGPDPKIARRVYAMLDDVFDETTMRYRKPHDDASVAKELAVSMELVIHLRRGAYGEIAPDPIANQVAGELDTLKDAVRGELEGLKNEHNRLITSITDKFKNEMAAARHSFDQDARAAMEIFNQQYEELKRKIEPLIKKVI